MDAPTVVTGNLQEALQILVVGPQSLIGFRLVVAHAAQQLKRHRPEFVQVRLGTGRCSQDALDLFLEFGIGQPGRSRPRLRRWRNAIQPFQHFCDRLVQQDARYLSRRRLHATHVQDAGNFVDALPTPLQSSGIFTARLPLCARVFRLLKQHPRAASNAEPKMRTDCHRAPAPCCRYQHQVPAQSPLSQSVRMSGCYPRLVQTPSSSSPWSRLPTC